VLVVVHGSAVALLQLEGSLLVVLAEGSDSMLAKELELVAHFDHGLLHLVLGRQGQEHVEAVGLLAVHEGLEVWSVAEGEFHGFFELGQGTDDVVLEVKDGKHWDHSDH